jgi:excisionase family DNA binding protein
VTLISDPKSAYLTAPEAAALLRVTERTIARFKASGRLPSLRLGPYVRFRRADVERMLEPASRAPITGAAIAAE